MSMILLETLEIPSNLRHGAVTIGNFDGVHRGHAKLIERITSYSKSHHTPSVVFTFHPHPACILHPERAPQPLTWINRKAKLLGRLGVDAVIACPTTPTILTWSAEEFFHYILCEKLAATHVVEGTNFFFGHHRSGNTQTLSTLCAIHHMTCELVQPVITSGEIVSSSRIRQLITDGMIVEANQLLTCPYRIRGMVIHGLARGRTLGFPTANLEAIDTLLPRHAIYAGRVFYNDCFYPAAIHIGPNRTFRETIPKVEIHILDFHNSIYGKLLKVDFLAFLREIISFPSQEALIQQVKKDILAVREIFTSKKYNISETP
ncbi:MAG: bifunctional riboflavin kinase/FAD synthetase [Planctomycetia bacterium]|nr:bifunctional riboflavin kinase/FAD synthetase [Planctomycetia bacterium]